MASNPRVTIRRTATGKLYYFAIGDDVYVDADKGIWIWGWEDKLMEVEGA